MTRWACLILIVAACGRERDPQHIDGAADASSSDVCNPACESGFECLAGSCSCQSARTICGTLCVDLRNGHEACGACGVACQSDETCAGGICVAQNPGQLCASLTSHIRALATDADSVYAADGGYCAEWEPGSPLDQYEGGIFRVDKLSLSVERLAGPADGAYVALSVDQDGVYWSRLASCTSSSDVIQLLPTGSAEAIDVGYLWATNLATTAACIYLTGEPPLPHLASVPKSSGSSCPVGDDPLLQASPIASDDANIYYTDDHGNLRAHPVGGGAANTLATVAAGATVASDGTSVYFDDGTLVQSTNIATLAVTQLASPPPGRAWHLEENADWVYAARCLDDTPGPSGARCQQGLVFRVSKQGGPVEYLTAPSGEPTFTLDATHLYWIDAGKLWRIAQ